MFISKLEFGSRLRNNKQNFHLFEQTLNVLLTEIASLDSNFRNTQQCPWSSPSECWRWSPPGDSQALLPQIPKEPHCGSLTNQRQRDRDLPLLVVSVPECVGAVKQLGTQGKVSLFSPRW